MLCKYWFAPLTALLLLAASVAFAQQETEQLPAFLQPPPIQRLRQGLAPLADELPDSSVPAGLLPPDASQGLFDQRPASLARGPQWVRVEYHWLPSGNCYRPPYFEDTMLERHGQAWPCLIQPAASGARFFGSIAALPYGVMVDPPWRPVSSLGHFRPGSATPCLLQRPPLRSDAGLFEAGVVVGLIFLVP